MRLTGSAITRILMLTVPFAMVVYSAEAIAAPVEPDATEGVTGRIEPAFVSPSSDEQPAKHSLDAKLDSEAQPAVEAPDDLVASAYPDRLTEPPMPTFAIEDESGFQTDALPLSERDTRSEAGMATAPTIALSIAVVTLVGFAVLLLLRLLGIRLWGDPHRHKV